MGKELAPFPGGAGSLESLGFLTSRADHEEAGQEREPHQPVNDLRAHRARAEHPLDQVDMENPNGPPSSERR